MKNLFILLFVVVSSKVLIAQDVTGDWYGTLNVQGTELDLVFHIINENEKLTATMDSPDQGASGIPVSSVNFDDPKLTLDIKSAGIEYSGKLIDDRIEGTFKQSGQSFELTLYREEDVKKK